MNHKQIKREPESCFELHHYIMKYLSLRVCSIVSLLSNVKNNTLCSLSKLMAMKGWNLKMENV